MGDYLKVYYYNRYSNHFIAMSYINHSSCLVSSVSLIVIHAIPIVLRISPFTLNLGALASTDWYSTATLSIHTKPFSIPL